MGNANIFDKLNKLTCIVCRLTSARSASITANLVRAATSVWLIQPDSRLSNNRHTDLFRFFIIARSAFGHKCYIAMRTLIGEHQHQANIGHSGT